MNSSKGIWTFLLLVAIATGVVYFGIEIYEDKVAKLPIYGPEVELNGETVAHVVPEFEFTNQMGRKVTRTDMQGKVTVVNFFFTSCPTICPKMMRNMQTVQELYLNDDNVVLLSHTVDPKRDNQARLAKYADAYHIDSDRWSLLTGSKKDLYRQARNGYYMAASQGDGGDHDFIHSENLVLIDRQMRIRGYYDGTNEKDVDQLIKDISKLKREKT